MKPNLFMNRFIQISAGIVGFLSAIVTIYVFWTQSKEGVNLQYHLTANTNVFDINADISRLDIIYENRSLKRG